MPTASGSRRPPLPGLPLDRRGRHLGALVRRPADGPFYPVVLRDAMCVDDADPGRGLLRHPIRRGLRQPRRGRLLVAGRRAPARRALRPGRGGVTCGHRGGARRTAGDVAGASRLTVVHAGTLRAVLDEVETRWPRLARRIRDERASCAATSTSTSTGRTAGTRAGWTRRSATTPRSGDPLRRRRLSRTAAPPDAPRHLPRVVAGSGPIARRGRRRLGPRAVVGDSGCERPPTDLR